MKILILSLPAAAGWGGSEELWAETASEATAGGHSVDVVPRVDHGDSADRLRQLAECGVRIHTRRTNPGEDGATAAIEVVPEAAYGLAQSADAVLLNAGGSIRELLEPPVISLIRQTDPQRLVVTIQLVSERDLLTDPERALAREVIARASRVAAPAWRSHATLQRVLAAHIPHVAVIPSPIGKGLGEYRAWPEGPVARFACVARLNPQQKGQDLLLEALPTPPWPDRDWHLTFYGRGIGRTYLEDLAGYYGHERRVTFAGQSNDMVEVWRTTHALVLPSREESMPIVILEALASGRPCIVTDVGDNARYVRNGSTGFVAAGDRPAAIREALEIAWERRDEWPEMGRRGRALFLAGRDPSPGRTVLSHLLKPQ